MPRTRPAGRQGDGLRPEFGRDWAERLGKWDMDNNALAEKGVYPTLGAVNYLVGDKQVTGLDFFLKATRRVNGDNMLRS